jgi:hypothetical protein
MTRPTFPEIHIPHLAGVALPPVRRVRIPQPTAPRLPDLAGAVAREMAKSRRLVTLPRGARVAVGVGSRGVADIPILAKAVVDSLKDRGLEPFIVPAMGSHGGGTAEGQRGVLAHLGVTEESVGAPVHATMETVEYGKTLDGIPCRFDAEAARADAAVIIARVKSHTSFDRPIESGLTKMVAVGLGKQEGARAVHRLGPRGYSEVLPALARIAIEASPVAFGIAVVESGRHEVVHVEGVEPESFGAADERLLVEAKRLLARLPFAQIDALLCEYVGKEISGAGMDYAVIGRTDIRGIPNPPRPFIHKIGVLGLTEATGGNGIGVGVADFMPRDTANRLDLKAMYMNAVTATMGEKARIPIVLPTEREVVQALVATSWALDSSRARYCQIRSTLHVEEILVSPMLLDDIAGEPGVETLGPEEPLRFDAGGRLLTRI